VNYAKGWYVYYNGGAGTFGELENNVINAKLKEFRAANPTVNSTIVEATLTGKDFQTLEKTKEYLQRNNKDVKIILKVDPKFKTDPSSPSVDPNKDYNFSIKISGVKI